MPTSPDAERAAQEARRVVSDPSELHGVGGPLWRALWTAAAQFSSEAAYVGQAFPVVEPAARCVLCGQLLSPDARERFLRLAEGVSAALDDELRTSQSVVDRLEAARLRLQDGQRAAPLVEELRAVDEDAATALAETVELVAGWASETGGGGDETLDVVPRRAGWLRERALPLAVQAELLLRVAEPAESARLQAESRELQARRWIAENRERIDSDVESIRMRQAVGRAVEDCDTRPITVESGRLTERYVTEALRESFANELQELSSNRVRVRIVPRGQYGAVYHRLELDGAVVGDARVAEVVSEGEFRAIALASFFAELGQAESDSAIVMDDPVSSLDHLNRERVAHRIVTEARRRQVIVFTHDLVFLHDLGSAADSADVSHEYRRLRLTSTHTGWPIPEPPWLGMKVRQRVDSLQQDLNRMRAMYDDGDIEAYEREARMWYGSLRETWERAVEEVLFADTIGRYRYEVKTNNLVSERVWLINEEDVHTIAAGMTKASAWIRGHDQPAAVNRPVPGPDDLRDDLAVLRDWAAAMRTRRRS